MNISKRLVPIFCILLVLFAVSIANGCSRKNESNVKDVVKNELDQLKNLNSETTQKYIPYKELFPGATENTGLSDEINEAFSLFFQKFDYKILDISVDQNQKTASALIRLTTLDAEALAKDFISASLQNEILETASGEENTDKNSNSLEERYLLLHKLLKNNSYNTADSA